eukprot:scaffold2021_cov176-Amphora_coffeaeformis.AAC.15
MGRGVGAVPSHTKVDLSGSSHESPIIAHAMWYGMVVGRESKWQCIHGDDMTDSLGLTGSSSSSNSVAWKQNTRSAKTSWRENHIASNIDRLLQIAGFSGYISTKRLT